MSKTNEEINIEVCNRFFDALARLKEDKIIRGMQPFTERYGYDRRNMLQQRREPTRGKMRPSWLVHLVEDFKVNPIWLLLGDGEFYLNGFNAEIVKNLQIPCK